MPGDLTGFPMILSQLQRFSYDRLSGVDPVITASEER
jgi:hypothetical protein